MYSSFAKNSYYIYLSDNTGQPLATTRFGLTTPGLKKIFESKRRAEFKGKTGPIDADSVAGAALLRYLEELPVVQQQSPGLLHGLQVQRVNLLWKSGRIEADSKSIARHP